MFMDPDAGSPKKYGSGIMLTGKEVIVLDLEH
jgi:hypothetical protein